MAQIPRISSETIRSSSAQTGPVKEGHLYKRHLAMLFMPILLGQSRGKSDNYTVSFETKLKFFEPINLTTSKETSMKKKQSAAQLDWAYAEEKVKLDYLESCKNTISSDEKFNTFRTNPEYGIVLESGEKGIGENNLRRLKKMAGAKWVENSIKIIAENDKFGGPELHSFDELLVKCSSSSI